MKAVIKDLNSLHVGEVVELQGIEGENYRVKTSKGELIEVTEDQLAIQDANEIIIYEAQYSRHPQDDYLKVQLAYLLKSEKFVSRIKNESIGNYTLGHYYGKTKEDFHKAFSDYLHR